MVVDAACRCGTGFSGANLAASILILAREALSCEPCHMSLARRLLLCRCWGLQAQFGTGAAGTMYFEPGGVFFGTAVRNHAHRMARGQVTLLHRARRGMAPNAGKGWRTHTQQSGEQYLRP